MEGNKIITHSTFLKTGVILKQKQPLQLKKQGTIKPLYPIWTAFLSVGKSCCRRRKQPVRSAPEKQESTMMRGWNINENSSKRAHSFLIAHSNLKQSNPKNSHQLWEPTDPTHFTHTISLMQAIPISSAVANKGPWVALWRDWQSQTCPPPRGCPASIQSGWYTYKGRSPCGEMEIV